MSETGRKITRAQAYAAANQLAIPQYPAQAIAEGTIRAYIAQHPDEDTIRKGHEALERLHMDALSSEDPVDERDEGPSVGDDRLAVRAAMYQPEEPA